MTSRTVGVDVGGTSVKGVVIDRAGRVAAEVRLPTPTPDPTGEGVIAAVAEVVAELAPDVGDPVGVVVPGIVDETRGTAVQSASLGWSDLPLAAMLRDRLQRDVAFGHDVRAGGIAEVTWGAAAEATGTVAFVPIGTGIAAALLVDGRPITADGWAGEIGQLRIQTGPHAGELVEVIASAAGTARRASEPDAKSVADRVAEGDPYARRVWNETIDVLAQALAALTAVLAPTTIVIGGGLSLAGATLLVPLAARLDVELGGLRRPALRAALLGDRAAAMGAASLAWIDP